MCLWQFELIFLRFCLNNFSLPSGRGYFSRGAHKGGVRNVFGALQPFLFFSLPHLIDDLKSSAKNMFYFLACVFFYVPHVTEEREGSTKKNLWEIAAGSENSENQKILEILPRIKFCFVCLGIFNFAKKNPEKKFFVYDVTKMKVVYFWGAEILSSRSKGNFDLPSKLLCIPFRRRATCVSKHFLFPSRSHMY